MPRDETFPSNEKRRSLIREEVSSGSESWLGAINRDAPAL